MHHDSELDHLRKAHRRLKARLDELERRIEQHLATRNLDPFPALVRSHSLNSDTLQPVPRNAESLPAHSFQI